MGGNWARAANMAIEISLDADHPLLCCDPHVFPMKKTMALKGETVRRLNIGTSVVHTVCDSEGSLLQRKPPARRENNTMGWGTLRDSWRKPL